MRGADLVEVGRGHVKPRYMSALNLVVGGLIYFILLLFFVVTAFSKDGRHSLPLRREELANTFSLKGFMHGQVNNC